MLTKRKGDIKTPRDRLNNAVMILDFVNDNETVWLLESTRLLERAAELHKVGNAFHWGRDFVFVSTG